MTLSEGSVGATTVVPERQHDPREQGLVGRELADHYGLKQSGARPSIPNYVRQLWNRRHFIVAYASARNIAMYTNARLGQLWQMLTPLLNVGVYFLIFGVLIPINRGIHNYLLYLVIGVFVFNFTQSAILSASRSISDQLGLIRALHFPRACLPVAATVIQLQQLMFSMLIIVVVTLVSGESITWHWLLVLPALALQFVFNTGSSLLIARAGATATDVSSLLPFLLRTWMYMSGVIYSVASFANKVPHSVIRIFEIDPTYVYITLVRHSLIQFHVNRHSFATQEKYELALAQAHKTMELPPHVWAVAVGWAVVAFVLGFLYFWKAEEKYGRG